MPSGLPKLLALRKQKNLRTREICFLGLLLIAAGCLHSLPSEPPTIRGNIAGTMKNEVLVVAPGGEAGCDRNQRLGVVIGPRTVIRRRSGGLATASDLMVGTSVSVWIAGHVLESCPGIVGAKIVVIENGGT